MVNIITKVGISFSWNGILVKKQNKVLEALEVLGNELAESSSCEWKSFGDDFFGHVKKVLTEKSSDQDVALVCSIFALGIEKCAEFGERLQLSGLCEVVKDRTSVCEVLYMFCGMCHVSKGVTEYVTKLGIQKAVMASLGGNKDGSGQRNFRTDAGLFFLLSFCKHCEEDLIPQIIQFPLKMLPPVESELFILEFWMR
jgi:hypothetical protein